MAMGIRRLHLLRELEAMAEEAMVKSGEALAEAVEEVDMYYDEEELYAKLGKMKVEVEVECKKDGFL
jgi:hypothetical protein